MLLKIVGGIIIAVGVVCIILGLDMNVVVSSGAQTQVYNTGLIASRQMTVSIGGALLVAGSIFLSAGIIRDAILNSPSLPSPANSEEREYQESQFLVRGDNGEALFNDDEIYKYAKGLHNDMPKNTALSVMVTKAPQIESIKSQMPKELASEFEKRLEIALQKIKQ